MNRWASPHLIRNGIRNTEKTLSSNNNKNVFSLPKNILLLRHGRSLGNDDETLFSRMPDWKIPLSGKGRQQAREAGRLIQQIVAGSTGTSDDRDGGACYFYVSPYRRTKETYEEVVRQFQQNSKHKTNILMTREEPRLREQDFGNFQNPEAMLRSKAERAKFGRFFYRFPDGGESGADVFDRVAAFCGTFSKDAQQLARPDATAVFVTHGITARMFIKRWLHWSVEDFEELHNPPNCGLLHLKRVGDETSSHGPAYRLTRESRELIKAPTETGIGRALQFGNSSSSVGEEKGRWDNLSETAWGL